MVRGNTKKMMKLVEKDEKGEREHKKNVGSDEWRWEW